MRIYFSGIGGVAIGPLMEIAHDAGHEVVGSDMSEGLMTQHLRQRGLTVHIGQDGSQISAEHAERPIDLLIHTAALPADHPELVFAREHDIRTGKRDELLAQIITEKQLKLIAVAGTHGKTTTTGMLVWALEQLGVPVSYSVGSTLSFGPSGKFDPRSEYFVYECDEFDRNFLHFSPWLSLVTSVDYDHPDIFPTEENYRAAFRQFGQQSERVVAWRDNADIFDPANLTVLDEVDPHITLHGLHNRKNATLVIRVIEEIRHSSSSEHSLRVAKASPWRSADGGKPPVTVSSEEECLISAAINTFPGTGRRFEKLADNLYSDYGHHPVEIAATLQMARELSDKVVLVYQPHQNVRQHEIRQQYTDEIFANASEIYWLPTYLSREDPNLPILTPSELTERLAKHKLHLADLDDQLWHNISAALQQGKLVLCMGAGSIDGWIRQQLADH